MVVGKSRGQAFETMMLVISVIVALAILAVLMGILGGIGTQFGSDPKSVMHDGLREVSSKGFGMTAAKKATFEKGVIILRKDVIQTDVAIQQDDMKFFGDGIITGTAATSPVQLDSSGKQITTNSKVDAYITVCGDASKPSAPYYCIAIARQPDKSTSTCKTSCGLS